MRGHQAMAQILSAYEWAISPRRHQLGVSSVSADPSATNARSDLRLRCAQLAELRAHCRVFIVDWPERLAGRVARRR